MGRPWRKEKSEQRRGQVGLKIKMWQSTNLSPVLSEHLQGVCLKRSANFQDTDFQSHMRESRSVKSTNCRLKTCLPWSLYELTAYTLQYLITNALTPRVLKQTHRWGLHTYVRDPPFFWLYCSQLPHCWPHPALGSLLLCPGAFQVPSLALFLHVVFSRLRNAHVQVYSMDTSPRTVIDQRCFWNWTMCWSAGEPRRGEKTAMLPGNKEMTVFPQGHAGCWNYSILMEGPQARPEVLRVNSFSPV